MSPKANEILLYFLSSNKEWFTTKEALNLFTSEKSTPNTIKILLKRMVDKGLLLRITDGVYYIVPFEQQNKDYIPNWNLLAEPLTNNEYYIGYYSALQLHQLTTQPSVEQQIIVNRQKKSTVIKGINFNFYFYNEQHYFGYRNIWIDSFHKVKCSDIEKTLIDCLYKPENSMGIEEVAKALYFAKDKIDYLKMLNYIQKFGSQIVIKRLGYLLELFEINSPIIADLQKMKTKSVINLSSVKTDKLDSKILSRWSIKLNTDIDTIKNAIND